MIFFAYPLNRHLHEVIYPCQVMLDSIDLPEVNINEISNTLINEWQDTFSDEDLPEQFLYYLFQAAERVSGILNRERVMASDIDKVTDWLLYDSKYYYLSEQLFHEICSPLLGTVNVKTIKQCLADKGIIKGEGYMRNYWTTKVSVINEYGVNLCQRRIRIDRLKVDRLGELSWQEPIESK